MVLEKIETCSVHVQAINDYIEFKLCQTELTNTDTSNDNFITYFTNTINKSLNKKCGS